MFTTLAEGNLLTLASGEDEADCRVSRFIFFSRWKMRNLKEKSNSQESQSLVATPSLAWVGRGEAGGSLTRYISPSLLHQTCCQNETEEACQCYPLLPMSTLQHCGKYSLHICVYDEWCGMRGWKMHFALSYPKNKFRASFSCCTGCVQKKHFRHRPKYRCCQYFKTGKTHIQEAHSLSVTEEQSDHTRGWLPKFLKSSIEPGIV